MLKEYKVDLNNKEKEISEKVRRENLYIEFVNSQEQGFIRFINYINSVVNILKQKAKVSQFIEIRARIKDINSAIANYEKNKLLDDVFGVEIICANEHEINIIKEELEKNFKSTRSKSHNKPNGYKAEHECYSVKEDSKSDGITDWKLNKFDVPAVECQFKTIEVELNPEASHHDYKKVNMEEIQNKLMSKTLKIGKEIPRMWVSRENEMKELTYKEIIQRIYPLVDITTIKEPEKSLNIRIKEINR